MRIMSFGEIIWDVYSPSERTLGGAPLNFAAYVAMQGCESYVASAVGNDALGKEALREIRALGINCDYVSTVNDAPSGQCLVSLSDSGIPSYNVLRDVAYDRIEYSRLSAPFDAICFGTLALRESHNRITLERFLTDGEYKEIFTDVNIRPPFFSLDSVRFCLEKSTIVKISDEELPTVSSLIFGRYTDLKTAASDILTEFKNIKLLLITCGGNGAYCYDVITNTKHYVPAAKATMVSSVGAGDSFGATFLVQYLRTHDIPYSLDLAARVSAFVVSNRESIPRGARELISTLVTK